MTQVLLNSSQPPHQRQTGVERREGSQGEGEGKLRTRSGCWQLSAITAWSTAFQPAAPSPYTHVCVCAQMLSHVNSSGPSGLMARQVALPMGVSRQEYCSGLPCPSPGDLSHPGIKSTSLVSSALAGRFFTTEPPGKLTHTHSPRQNQETEWRSE